MKDKVYVLVCSSASDYEHCGEEPRVFSKFDDAVKAMDEMIEEAREFEFFKYIDAEDRRVDRDTCYAMYDGCQDDDPYRNYYSIDIYPKTIE